MPTHDARPTTPIVGTALTVAFLAVLLYVSSSGPAFRLRHSNGTTDVTLETVYAPLIWLCDHNEFADRVMYWYGDTGYAAWKMTREVNRLSHNGRREFFVPQIGNSASTFPRFVSARG